MPSSAWLSKDAAVGNKVFDSAAFNDESHVCTTAGVGVGGKGERNSHVMRLVHDQVSCAIVLLLFAIVCYCLGEVNGWTDRKTTIANNSKTIAKQ